VRQRSDGECGKAGQSSKSRQGSRRAQAKQGVNARVRQAPARDSHPPRHAATGHPSYTKLRSAKSRGCKAAATSVLLQGSSARAPDGYSHPHPRRSCAVPCFAANAATGCRVRGRTTEVQPGLCCVALAPCTSRRSGQLQGGSSQLQGITREATSPGGGQLTPHRAACAPPV